MTKQASRTEFLTVPQADDRCDAPKSASHCSQPAQKGALPRCIGRSRGGLTTKLQVVCDHKGRPLLLHLSEGQANDHKTAAAVVDQLPPARFLLADRAYGSAAFRQALTDQGITPCISTARQTSHPARLRPRPLQAASQDRKHVRPPQGLATHPHQIRQVRPHLPVRNRFRNSLHLLDQ
jgi:transposase